MTNEIESYYERAKTVLSSEDIQAELNKEFNSFCQHLLETIEGANEHGKEKNRRFIAKIIAYIGYSAIKAGTSTRIVKYILTALIHVIEMAEERVSSGQSNKNYMETILVNK